MAKRNGPSIEVHSVVHRVKIGWKMLETSCEMLPEATAATGRGDRQPRGETVLGLRGLWSRAILSTAPPDLSTCAQPGAASGKAGF